MTTLTTTYPNHTNIDHPHNDHDDRVEFILYLNVTEYEIQRIYAFVDIEYTKEPCHVKLLKQVLSNHHKFTCGHPLWNVWI
jgi:hypothetical protein